MAGIMFEQSKPALGSEIVAEASMAYTGTAIGASELAATGGDGSDDLKRHFRLGESLIHSVLVACGVLSMLTTLGIVIVLGIE